MSSRSSKAQNDELVEDRGEGGELGGEVGDNQSINEEEGEGSRKGSVDDTLEENADKLNLTAINVKSILHHLLKDKRVISLIKSSDSEKGDVDQEKVSEQIHDIIGPILTRSRVRESAAAGKPVDPLSPIKALTKLPGTPLKKKICTPRKVNQITQVQTVTDILFPEDDPSDDEYQPDKQLLELDSSEEEGDTSVADTDVSFTSTPRDPNPHCLVPSGLPGPSGVTHSPQDIPLSALPPKKRVQRRLDMTQGLTQGLQESSLPLVKTNEELIANRTRSKFPIEVSLEEIEAAFKAPDLDPLLEDSHMELDEEDVQWRVWLQELMHGGPPTVSDSGEVEEDDQDYNFLADQGKCSEEVEEYRNDKAVKIPEHEVSALIEELLGTYGEGGQMSGNVTDHPVSHADSDAMQVDPLLSASMLLPLTECRQYLLTQEQVVLLYTQIQKYFQLLMQSFVLARFEPSLVFLSQIAAKAVEELNDLCERADAGQECAVWRIPDRHIGMQIVQSFNPYESITISNDLHGVPKPPVSDIAASIMFNCPLFSNFKELLPKMGYAPLTSAQLSKTSPFTPTEDNLLAIGMERFGGNNWKDICFCLLPTKTTSQLKNHVKNLCAQKTKSNIIKSYKKTGRLSLTPPPEEKDLPQWFKIASESQKSSTKTQTTPTLLAPKLPMSSTSDKKSPGTCPIAMALEGIPIVSSGLSPEKAKVVREQLKSLGLTLTPQASPKKATSQPHIQSKPTSSLTSASDGTSSSRDKTQTTPAIDSVISSKIFRRNVCRKSPMRPLKRRRRPMRGLEAHKTLSHSDRAREKEKMVSVLTKAGVDSSDPHSRFLYGYMLQVKSELTDSPEVYDKFLKVLMDSDDSGLTPVETFGKVKDVLKPWPHLLKIFSDFLQPQEATKAKVFKDKVSISWGKSFIAKLEEVFSSDPGQLKELMSILNAADDNCPREKLRSDILPLFAGHEDLLEEFLGYLSGLPPSKQHDDVYEKVVLNDACDLDELSTGDVERVVLSAQSEELTSGAKDPVIKEPTAKPSRPSSKRPRGEQTGSHSLTKRRKAQVTLATTKDQTEQDQTSKEGDGSNSKDTPSDREWTKDEDKAILESTSKEGEKSRFDDIAMQLQRTREEVAERFGYLMDQYQRLLQQHQGKS